MLGDLNEKRTYELYSSYTGKVLETFDTRSEATSEQTISERDGDFSLRIRTVVEKL